MTRREFSIKLGWYKIQIVTLTSALEGQAENREEPESIFSDITRDHGDVKASLSDLQRLSKATSPDNAKGQLGAESRESSRSSQKG